MLSKVFIAMGQMKPGVRMPAECAGIVTAVGTSLSHQYKVGDRVCGRDGSPFASFARCKGFTCAHMPDSMSFAEGASISVIFGTSHYCLMDVARLQNGQTILIHAASGGVGQSAIQFAQLVGAEIFATCGSTVKRQLLMDVYGIPEDHIFSTRQRTFKQGILRMTGGRGVDVVLNSLAGEHLQDSFAVVAPLGIFIEIGKADIYKKSGLEMAPFDRNIAFQAVDMTVLDKIRPQEQQARFQKIMEMFTRGELKPVSPITEIPISNIEEAFRLIQAHKHAGKVVLVADENTMVRVAPEKPAPFQLKKNGSYIIAGGLGDLGWRVARYMAMHGAGHIVILSRRKLDDKTHKILHEELAALGAELHVMTCDVTNKSAVEAVAMECQATLPPVKGIVHATMVVSTLVLCFRSLRNSLQEPC
jgi:NADPH:quinone reductase-like Zn-dependent oxidoreductase